LGRPHHERLCRAVLAHGRRHETLQTASCHTSHRTAGYPESTIVGIGIALLASTFLYVIPRTSILGAILLTGYLGGAVASNVRAAAPLFNILFPVVFAALVWGGLWLRDQRLRQLLPL